jgi:hypothetical protein
MSERINRMFEDEAGDGTLDSDYGHSALGRCRGVRAAYDTKNVCSFAIPAGSR